METLDNFPNLTSKDPRTGKPIPNVVVAGDSKSYYGKPGSPKPNPTTVPMGATFTEIDATTGEIKVYMNDGDTWVEV